MRPSRAFAIAVAVLLLAQSAAAVDKGRLTIARAKTTKGERLLHKQDYGRAERAFRAAIAVEPLWPPAYLGLGAALVAQQRFEEALDTLAEAESRFVAWEQELNLADLKKRQLTQQQMLELRTLAAEAETRVPSPTHVGPAPDAIARAVENTILREQFVFRERWQLEGFEAIPPQVFYLEGIAYLRTGRPDLGIDVLKVCLLVDGDHGLAHYNLAVAFLGQGEVAESREHLEAALAAGVAPHAQFVADLELAQQRLSIEAPADQIRSSLGEVQP